MDQAVAALLVEGSKIALQSYFTYMRMAGKTPEEMMKLYTSVKAEFDAKDPDLLPDV